MEDDKKELNNVADLEVEESEEVEAYMYCDTKSQRCLNDCIGGGPMLSTLR